MKASSFLVVFLIAALLFVGWQFFNKPERKMFDIKEVIKTDSNFVARINMYEDSIANLVAENKKMQAKLSMSKSLIDNLKKEHKKELDTIRNETSKKAVERFLYSTLDGSIPMIDPIKVPAKSIRIANELIAERHHFKTVNNRLKDDISTLKELNANLAFINTRQETIIETIEQRNIHLKSNLEAQEEFYEERLRKQKFKNRIKLGIVSGLAALLIIFG